MTDDNTCIDFRWGIPYFDVADKLTWVKIYDFMLNNYARLGVKPVEMMFIIHLSQFHYNSANSEGAHPSLAVIADRMGYTDAQGPRRLKNSLVEKGLLEVEMRNGNTSIYNFRPLTERCLRLWSAENGIDVMPILSFPESNLTQSEAETEHEATETPIKFDRGTPIKFDRGGAINSDRGPLSNLIAEEEKQELEDKQQKQEGEDLPTHAVSWPADDQKSSSKSEDPEKSSKQPIKPFDYVLAFCEVKGIDYRKLPKRRKGQELKYAKDLQEAGYTPDEVGRCLAYLMSDPFWEGKKLGLATVSDQIIEWVSAGEPARYKQREGNHAKAGRKIRGNGLNDRFREWARSEETRRLYGSGGPV